MSQTLEQSKLTAYIEARKTTNDHSKDDFSSESIERFLKQYGLSNTFRPMQSLIEQEIEWLHLLLKKNSVDDKDNKQLIIDLLIFNYSILKLHFEKTSQQAELKKVQSQLKVLSQINQSKNNDNTHKINQWYNQWFHATTLRTQIDAINMGRMYFFFANLTLKELLIATDRSPLFGHTTFASDVQSHHTFQNITKNIRHVGNIASVAFCGLFFLMNCYEIFKQYRTGPKGAAIEAFHKQSLDMLNNVVWGTVNFITSYASLSGIPPVLVVPIISIALVFDVILIQVMRQQATRRYNAHEARIAAELNELGYKENDNTSDEPICLAKNEEHITVLLAQREQLREERAISKRMMDYTTVSAVILLAFFTASAFIPPVGIVLLCYAFCLVGIARFMAQDTYKQKVKAAYQLSQYEKKFDEAHDFSEDQTHIALKQAASDSDKVWKKDVFEKTAIPALILFVCAANLPAGIVLGMLYAVTKLCQRYHAGKQTDAAQQKQTSGNTASHSVFFSKSDKTEKDTTFAEGGTPAVG